MDRYANEELSPNERESFESHLRNCRECQQQLARLHRLVAALRSVPAPPVPHGFVDRVMVRAQEIQGLRQSVEVRQRLTDWQSVPRKIRTWWGHVGMAHLANAVAAVAAGLVLGLVLGQQTWRFSASPAGTDRPATSVDAELVYSLDYLSGSPRGSFTDAYLSLTRVASDGEL